MQKRGAGEPWHHRGILDWVPSPVAAPSEHVVGPVHSKKNAAGEKSPRDHRPSAGDVDPLLTGVFHRQGGKRESERDGKPNVAQVQHGRVNDHLGILKERS